MIDAHQHFWIYNEEQYAWINDDMQAIRRDFLPNHLIETAAPLGISGAVSVQADQSLNETERLLAYAGEYDFIRGVVGWVPLISPDVERVLASLVLHPKLKGVRHVLQDEPDAFFMLRPDFNRGVDTLRRYELAYDILIYERHLPQTIEFVDRHPDQVFVLDHVAKPRVRDAAVTPWRENLRELAHRQNVFCKVSGLVTEANHRSWTEDQLVPYLETVLDIFGPSRLMFGSDWPVCLLAAPYSRWLEIVQNFTARLSTDEQDQIFKGTASTAYRL
jgi:L-fuconolactonase